MEKSDKQIENFSALLKAAQKGQQSARDELGKIYFPLVKQIAAKFKYVHYLGEDAVGEGCVAFTEALNIFKGREQTAFENYFCKAVYNRLNRKLQANYEKCLVECHVEWDADIFDKGYGLDHSMMFYLKTLHSILTERQLQIVEMRLAELKDVEIAKLLGISAKTVGRELQAIRGKVKGQLFS